MASTLESYVNRMVSIITADGRNFIGTLKGFDQTINLILDDTHERIYSPNQGVEQVSEQLGGMVTKPPKSPNKHMPSQSRLWNERPLTDCFSNSIL